MSLDKQDNNSRPIAELIEPDVAFNRIIMIIEKLDSSFVYVSENGKEIDIETNSIDIRNALWDGVRSGAINYEMRASAGKCVYKIYKLIEGNIAKVDPEEFDFDDVVQTSRDSVISSIT